MKQKIIKAGPHSLAVVIPASFRNALGIKKGEMVEVHSDIEKALIKLHFKGNLQQLILPQSNLKRAVRNRKN
mgnify:CR=1 FL=1